ncbi:hypothetical protein CEXT_580971 [Caerostris extrusa]|uniref:Uncharacterized protein n=1 Tax=Caerostris extrusa TaxID=172846 RepID=A0AAV4QBS1_CAEEX|nr:hypothetical protein CEXT_580971 [Caerostris extrusa]
MKVNYSICSVDKTKLKDILLHRNRSYSHKEGTAKLRGIGQQREIAMVAPQNVVCSLRQTRHLPIRKIESRLMFVDNQFYFHDGDSNRKKKMTAVAMLVVAPQNAVCSLRQTRHLPIRKKNRKPSLMFVDNQFYFHDGDSNRKKKMTAVAMLVVAIQNVVGSLRQTRHFAH